VAVLNVAIPLNLVMSTENQLSARTPHEV
jgi:hypothetical protein